MEVVAPLRMITPQGESVYNRLNANMAQELTWPPKMLTPANRRSRNRYCEFHNDYGHDTEECVALCFEIEKMVKNEKLICFQSTTTTKASTGTESTVRSLSSEKQ
jgi:hypothetical protein